MDYEKYYGQMMYSVTMAIIRKSLKEGVISQEEYERAEKIMHEKYNPVQT